MKPSTLLLLLTAAQIGMAHAADSSLASAVAKDYQAHLAPLFDHFHRNPELSYMEVKTAARLADELRSAGFSVTEKVGGTGVVALLKNGLGPLVMMRADMDGLPVEEKTGLANASTVKQKDREGNLFPVAHACGHDMHMTSLVGTARQMAQRRGQWSGTLMLIGQPAEERSGGAGAMLRDRLWERFGRPDYAMSLHVTAGMELGKLFVEEGATYAGVDTIDILVRGIGSHGASPHQGKDPVVLGAQIVLALQTIVTRDLAPRESAIITVGSFQGGTKHNIIADSAKLQLTVRSENPKARAILLDGIRRVAANTARAAGIAEDNLPVVTEADAPAWPVVNDVPLTRRLRQAWTAAMGPAIWDSNYQRQGMGAEDFSELTREPLIPSVYFRVGTTPQAVLAAQAAGGAPEPGNHSPRFRVIPEQSVRTGVEATVVALLDLMKK